MLTLYWSLLLTGVLFALVSALLGDIIGSALDGMLDFLSIDGVHWFQPMVLFSGITILGGAGILLTHYSPLTSTAVLLLSLLLAVGGIVPLYLLYIKPLRDSESSLAYSMQELTGHIGEVSVPVPAVGCGEVLLRLGGGITNHIAASFEAVAIPSHTRVVVVEVKDSVVYVSRLDTDLETRSDADV